MTRIFDKETGEHIPITIVKTGANVVHQVKTDEKDGYRAVQLGFEPCSENRLSKPVLGHLKRHGQVPTRVVKEFELDADEQVEAGQKIGVEMFEDVKYVDVVGTTKGRGFSGTIKRHHFRSGRETHGNTNHREHGSTGESRG